MHSGPVETMGSRWADVEGVKAAQYKLEVNLAMSAPAEDKLGTV